MEGDSPMKTEPQLKPQPGSNIGTNERYPPKPDKLITVPGMVTQEKLDQLKLTPEELNLEPSYQTKDQISSSYMETCKAKYKTDQPSPKYAIVVGASSGNIGLTIAAAMKGDGWSTRIYDKSNWKRSSIEKEDVALILANSTNWLDWVENFPARKAEKIIADTLLESILSSQEFVSRTLGTPYRKKIIFIGSMAYRNVLNGSSVYCAAKAGIAQYARCLAWELAPKGYDVFCVHPSNTLETPMTEATIEGLMAYRKIDRKEAEAYWAASLPRESFLTKKEIAETVLHLLSPSAVYMSGCQIELGGGQR